MTPRPVSSLARDERRRERALRRGDPSRRSAGPAAVAPGASRWTLAATVLGSGHGVSRRQRDQRRAAGDPEEPRSIGRRRAYWVVEAYALFLSSLVLAGGSLSDRFGRRRTFEIGVALFAATSAACGLADGPASLIAARAAQGVAAALLVPSSLALLGARLPWTQNADAPWARGRRLTAIASAVGPVFGGWLVEAVSWRAVFFINLPIAAIVLAISRTKVAESRNPDAGRLDLPGAFLATAGLGGLVFRLIESATRGAGRTPASGALAAGAAALAGFGAVERRSDHPMARLALFRVRAFASANILTFFLRGARSGLLFPPLRSHPGARILGGGDRRGAPSPSC